LNGLMTAMTSFIASIPLALKIARFAGSRTEDEKAAPTRIRVRCGTYRQRG
jgi:hypothetical protein